MASPLVPKPARSEKTPIFRFFAAVLLPPMHVVARYVIHNPERVPTQGAFVLAPNHYSEIDPVVMGLAMWKAGRMPRYLAKASLFKIPVVGALLRRAGQIPVERAGTRGSDPLAAARKIANEGLAVVVYPEGTLTRDPDLWPMRGKTGAVRIALTHGIPITPVAHWGTDKVMARYSRKISFFPPKRIDVKVGDPVDLSKFADRPLDNATLTEATAVVMAAITELLADLRGETPPKELWDPSKHNQKDTGRF